MNVRMNKWVQLAKFIVVLLTYWHQTCAQLDCGCCKRCPDGWVYFENSCYLFADESRYTWTEAAHFCGLHHAHLAVVESKQENDFLVSWISRLIDVDQGHNAFWLGASDDVVEGSWKWYTDDSDLTYTNWEPGQPNSQDGHNEDCLFLYNRHNAGYLWHDGGCNTDLSHAVCEMGLDEELTIIG